MNQSTLLPAFNNHGLLPKGDYPLTINELKRSKLVNGTKQLINKGWDNSWRLHLVNNAEILINQLWKIGIKNIYLDGSFVENKLHPNDIDGYFECDLSLFASGQLQRDLNKSDPKKIWTWDPKSRKSYRGYTKKQLPMWHAYRVELYPHFGQPSGIRDKHGNQLLFPSAFRLQRSSNQSKGIIKIVK